MKRPTWVAFAVVAACLYAPFAWLLTTNHPGNSSWWSWFMMWPILPASVLLAALPRDWGILVLVAMTAATCAVLWGATWSARRWGLVVGMAVSLAVSIYSSMLAHALFWF